MPKSPAADGLLAPGEYPIYLAFAAVAIYGCVPETDQMPAVGAMAVGLSGVELLTRQRSAPIVTATATLIVLWSGLFGATGRGSAIVGALFAFWPIVLVITLALAARPLPAITRLTIGAIAAVAAVGVARTGGIQPTTPPAINAVAVAAPVSLAVALVVVAVSGRLSASANRR